MGGSGTGGGRSWGVVHARSGAVGGPATSSVRRVPAGSSSTRWRESSGADASAVALPCPRPRLPRPRAVLRLLPWEMGGNPLLPVSALVPLHVRKTAQDLKLPPGGEGFGGLGIRAGLEPFAGKGPAGTVYPPADRRVPDRGSNSLAASPSRYLRKDPDDRRIPLRAAVARLPFSPASPPGAGVPCKVRQHPRCRPS